MDEHDNTRIAVKYLIARHEYQENRLKMLETAYKELRCAFERYQKRAKELSTEGA